MDYSYEQEQFNQLAEIEPGLLVLEAAVLKYAEICKGMKNYNKNIMWNGYDSHDVFGFSETLHKLINPDAEVHKTRAGFACSDATLYINSLLPKCTDDCFCCDKKR